jgi:hypothetical protein
VSRQTMLDLVNRGNLQTIRIDTCLLVKKLDVEQYKPETAVRPPKKNAKPN